MKLQSFGIVLVLGVVGIARVVRSMCLVRNTPEPKSYGFQCLRSNDYLADVNKAPIDITRLMFTASKIQVIRNKSFVRLGESLMTLSISNSGVREIEDNAFQGLTKLEVLDFKGNKLEIIKAVWFKELASLAVVTFKNNQVKSVEDGFFTTVPTHMDFFDVSGNQLTCLPVTALVESFRVRSLHVKHNPLTWSCQTLLMNWFENMEFETDSHDRPHHIDLVGQPYDLARICAARLPSKLHPDEKFLNKCAEQMTDEFLPLKGNYTGKQVCEALKDESPPLMGCTN